MNLRILPIALFLIFILAGPAAPLQATQTHWLTDSGYTGFADGSLEGVTLHASGWMETAPATRLALDLDDAILWAVEPWMGDGFAIATGPRNKVLHWKEGNEPEIVFETESALLTSLATDEKDRLYLATSSKAAVFRLARPDGLPEQFWSPPAQYIWDLHLEDGVLYATTGLPAALWAIPLDHSKEAKKLFETEDEHLTRIVVKEGQFYLASTGQGLVYRVSREGKGEVLSQVKESEVRSLAVVEGTVYFAGYEGKKNSGSNGGNGGIWTDWMNAQEGGEGQARRENGDSTAQSIPSYASTLFRRTPEGYRLPVWRGQAESVSAMLPFGEDSLILGTNHRGRLYLYEDRDVWARLTELEKGGEVTLIQPWEGEANRILVGTSQPAAIYQLGGRSGRPSVCPLGTT